MRTSLATLGAAVPRDCSPRRTLSGGRFRPSPDPLSLPRIVDALRQPFDILNYKISIGGTVGLALIPRDGTKPEELLAVAKTNLQRVRREAGEQQQREPGVPLFTV